MQIFVEQFVSAYVQSSCINLFQSVLTPARLEVARMSIYIYGVFWHKRSVCDIPFVVRISGVSASVSVWLLTNKHRKKSLTLSWCATKLLTKTNKLEIKMKMFVLWRLGRIQIYKYDNPSEQKVRFTIDLVRTLANLHQLNRTKSMVKNSFTNWRPF